MTEEQPTLGELYRILLKLEVRLEQVINEKLDRHAFEEYVKRADETHKELEREVDEVRGWIISGVRLVLFIVITAIIGLVVIPLPGK